MSLLSTEIEKRIAELRKSQKDVCTAFHDALGKRGKQGEGVDYKTVPPKLSKLLSGSPGGESFFFGSEARVAALASALKWKPAELQALRASSDTHQLLILHPDLPAECRTFIKQQATQKGAGFSCVEVTPEGEDQAARREELRRVAGSNPGCLVVTEGEGDNLFLDGVGVRATRVKRRARGWSLVAAPDLIPLPPPEPPRTADSDGMPMVNPPGFVEALKEEVAKSSRVYGGGCLFRSEKVFEAARDGLWDARKVEREPTFRIDHLLGWVRRELPKSKVHLVDPAPTDQWNRYDMFTAEMVYAALTGTPDETYLWAFRARAFVLGPAEKEIRQVLGGTGDPISMPGSLARLKVYLGDGNPWRHEKKRWNALCSEVFEECGVKMDDAYDRWLAATDVEKQERGIPGDYPSRDKSPPRTWTVKREESALGAKARAHLRALSRRELTIDWRFLGLPFELEAIASAPLVALPVEKRDLVHVVANLGAGWVVRLRALKFTEEEREPLRVVDSGGYACQLDGGDVHVWIQRSLSDLLEGQPLARVLDRREERRRRQQEDAYRDDDDD